MANKEKSELDILKDRFLHRLEGNYPNLTVYLNDKLEWAELDAIKGEILNCLMIGLGMASITLTNHLLEKVMKLALIYNEIGFVMIKDIEAVEAYAKAHQEYGDQDLYKTIEWNHERQVISSATKDALHRFRKTIRNGFSHASPSKTFGDSKARFAMGNFLKPGLSKIKEVKIAELHPSIQAHAISDFVATHALPYFDLVYGVIKEVEHTIGLKHNK